MARYVTKVRCPWSVERAFAYMADLRNFATWDPGVRQVVQTSGTGGGADAVFDVTVVGKPKDLVLAYRTVEYDAPHQFLVIAESRLLVSEDRVRVTPEGSGCIVEYDAQLRLKGLLSIADLVLKPFFTRIGDRATAGLRTALEGTPA
jgi:hypothetical protein